VNEQNENIEKKSGGEKRDRWKIQGGRERDREKDESEMKEGHRGKKGG